MKRQNAKWLESSPNDPIWDGMLYQSVQQIATPENLRLVPKFLFNMNLIIKQVF